MKYMTFNSSCSYAGLANLLSFQGIETEDRAIALEMGLPYLFDRKDGQYLSGPMLQGAKWFGLYLHPLGFTFTERQAVRDEVCPFLRNHSPAMLGIRVTPESKHAVVCIGCESETYRLINNKHRTSPEPETLELTGSELLSRLDEVVTIGFLERIGPVSVPLRPYLERSLDVFTALQTELMAFCSQEQLPDAQRRAMNGLFRPILLDGVTMLELLEEERLAAGLRKLRGQFMETVRTSLPATLSSCMDMSLLTASMAGYARLIAAEMEAI